MIHCFSFSLTQKNVMKKKTRCDDHLGLIEKKLLRNIANFKPIRSRALANWKKSKFSCFLILHSDFQKIRFSGITQLLFFNMK